MFLQCFQNRFYVTGFECIKNSVMAFLGIDKGIIKGGIMLVMEHCAL